jgi:hypothetical protein
LSVARELHGDEVLRVRKRCAIIVEAKLASTPVSNLRAGSMLRACVPTAVLGKVWRRTAITRRWVSEALCGKVLRMAVRRTIGLGSGAERPRSQEMQACEKPLLR